MKLKSAHRSVLSRVRRIQRALVAPFRIFNVFSTFRARKRSRRSLLVTLSRVVLVLLMVLLLVCTVLDILRQSFSSGQFWNSIIVIVSFSIIILWACTLHLVRKVDVARWVRSIPRRKQISSSDITARMMVRIQDKREECRHMFLTQADFSLVEHAGLRNPLQAGEGSSSSDVPYWELADIIPGLLEHNVTMAIPGLSIPLDSTLREYVLLAIQEKALVVSEEDAPTVERFIELYERLRYSSRSMSYSMLTELMDSLIKVGNMVEIREGELYNPQRRYQNNRRGSAISSFSFNTGHQISPAAQHSERFSGQYSDRLSSSKPIPSSRGSQSSIISYSSVITPYSDSRES